MTRITFAVPRYGAEVVGGAEWGARTLATRLAADGYDVSVLTSCARSHVTWADEYSPGSTMEDGVSVDRFPVERTRAKGFDDSSAEVLSRPGDVSESEALAWIDAQGPSSTGLLDAIADVDDGVLAFYPYLYQPTVRGIHRAKVPTVLHAAAHREAPLDLPIFDDVFQAASGLAHHSRAEQELVVDRFPAVSRTPQVVLGLPVELSDPDLVDAEAARRSLDLGDEPFVVCLGRVDRGKGTHELIERFSALRQRRGGGRLILAGPVIDKPPASSGVQYLGPVPEEHKLGLLAAADVLVNPSTHESFSIVVLEAWLAGTPVLVNGWCGPTRDHCVQSGGGLWYTGIADFESALSRLLDDADARSRMARAGRAYVRSSYSWDAVRTRHEALLSRLG